MHHCYNKNVKKYLKDKTKQKQKKKKKINDGERFNFIWK